MPPAIAACVFGLGILALFALDRDREARTSWALWISVLWLIIVGSRPVSVWLRMGPLNSSDSARQLLDGSPVDRFVFACLLVAGLIVLFGRVRQVGSFLRANTPILLFFIYGGISSIWSDYPDVAFKRWTKAVGDLVMVLILLTDSQPAAALKRWIARAGFLLLPTSILFIKYYPDLGRGYDPWTGMPVLCGVTTNKNSLGVITLMCGLGAAWHFFDELGTKDKEHRLRHLVAHAILLSMAFWLLVKADSRTSLVCFLFAGTLLAVTNLTKFGRKPRVVHLFAIGALLASVFAIFLDSAGGLVAAVGRDPSLTGRTEVWHKILGLAANPLFGAGFESFWLGPRLQMLWSTFGWHPNEAHNGYLEVYLNLGWIGVGLLAVLLITGYRNAVAAFRRDMGSGSFRLASILVAAVYSLTEAGFRMLNPIWILFLLVAITVPEAPTSANSVMGLDLAETHPRQSSC